ncbi:hypothetical protein SLS62_010454 [Diatrype stigma]|uniref:DUF1996 domain-containing protein n=1 Tax=Diatrype stigma TaxID=117547 RepID=A0AAN9YI63_9PEZI
MKTTTAGVVGYLAAVAAAAKDARTFAVLRFNGQGFLTEGRMDPIVDPGKAASHYHGIMGGSNFDITLQGDVLLDSNCTTAKIANDFSNYWVPALFFQDPNDQSKFTKVPLFYMNVYYFFEPTNDEVKAFPPGLKMLSGDTHTRNPPKSAAINLDPNQGDIQPVQFTCPRSSYNPASYPANSDGSTAGMQDPQNEGAGAGFPLYPCDGYGSPLRQDIHFPSCYNPAVGLDDYKNNMAWPATGTDGKQDCPEGYTHVPHIFYEVYWDTPQFDGKWTPDGKNQPFVFSNGDATGFSSHGDFVAGWQEDTLQTIIDTCNAGSLGMDTCPTIPGGLNQNQDCKIDPVITEPVSIMGNSLGSSINKLPGDNEVTGWGRGGVTGGSVGSSSSGSDAAAAAVPEAVSSQAVAAQEVATPTSAAKAQVTSAIESPAVAAESVVTNAAGGMETVWDVVTVTATETAYVDPTEAPQRRSHRHGHMARHAAHHAGERR